MCNWAFKMSAFTVRLHRETVSRERGKGAFLSFIVLHFDGALKQVMISASHSVLTDIYPPFFLFVWFATSKLFNKCHPTWKTFSRLTSFFSIHVQHPGLLLCNHISGSFMTALSQHAMHLTPKRSPLFSVGCRGESCSTQCAKTEAQRKQNISHSRICEHNQCLLAHTKQE